MIRVVIDTNVIISAFINPAGAPGRIKELMYSGTIIPVITPNIFSEINRVLNYTKFNFAAAEKWEILKFLSGHVEVYNGIKFTINNVPKDDLKFVYATKQFDADCLVTGNIKHFTAVSNVIKVITPAEFIKHYEATAT